MKKLLTIILGLLLILPTPLHSQISTSSKPTLASLLQTLKLQETILLKAQNLLQDNEKLFVIFKQQISDLQASIKLSETQVEQLRLENETLQTSLDKASKSIEDYSQRLQLLQSQVTDIETQVKMLVVKIQELTKTVEFQNKVIIVESVSILVFLLYVGLHMFGMAP